MRQSLAIKYRPSTFTEVCGQQLTVDILQRVLETGNYKNCILLAGQSGAGKTTIARILANKINKGIGEPIEMDCASVGGVENIRAIIDSANERSLVGEYKIFILDECHAISSAGWQAFLKCIEEPPLYTIFIFCTTEPHKIPTTILNRLQRYNITKIDTQSIYKRLLYVCQSENFINYTDTCDLISKLANGCMRDALTYLDQCADYSNDLSIANTGKILGAISYETMLKLTGFIYEKNEAKIFAVIESLDANGTNLKQFITNYLDFMLDIAKFIIFKNILATTLPSYLLNNTDPLINLQEVTNRINLEWANLLITNLLDLKNMIKYDSHVKTSIEAMLIKFCRG